MSLLSNYLCQLAITSSLAVSPRAAVAPTGSVASDSSGARKYAEQLQQRFERTRWQHLPWSYGSPGRCDLRIGQYCFTFDDDAEWDPPPENPEVRDARNELVRMLDSLRAVAPRDTWILAQLVRYGVEAGEFDVAKRVTDSCAITEDWLCSALSGYVHHMAGEYHAAEHAFDQSLRLMDHEQRCDWEDVTDLLTGPIRGIWRDRDCHDRSGLLDTLFWLSDPLYLVPGNELRTEHFARQVASLMYRQARGPDQERWNQVTHKIIMRYGWPTGWERRREDRTSFRPPMITHYGTDGSATFLPTRDILAAPTSAAPRAWDLDPDRPQSSHGPQYADEAFMQLTADIAMFRTGDSTTAVSIVSLSHDSLSRGEETEFGIALSKDPYAAPTVQSWMTQDTTLVIAATAAASPHLVSIEALARPAGVAGRARFGLDLGWVHRPGLVASDVLVLQPIDSLPDTLDEALPLVRRADDYTPGERLVLYWELYGVRTNDRYSTSISLDKTSKGIFRRLAEITPFASHTPAVSIAWDDSARDLTDTFTRAIAVDLPTELSSGRYRLTVTIVGPAGERIERSVELLVHAP